MAAENGADTLLSYRRTAGGAAVQDVLELGRARGADVGADGTVVVADRERFDAAPAGLGFAGVQRPSGIELPFASDVAVSDGGTVYLAAATDGAVTLYERHADGQIDDMELAGYDVATTDAVPDIAVAAGRDGAVSVVWTQPAGPVRANVRAELFARTRRVGGSFGPLQRLDTSRRPELSPRLASAGGGRVVAAWVAAHARRGRQPPRKLFVSFSAPGPGAFGPPEAVSSFGRVAGGSPAVHGRDARSPDLASLPDGRAALAWSAGCPRCDTRVEVVTATATGRFGEPRVLSPLGILADGPSVALDGAGGAAAVWTQQEPVTHAQTTAVVARTPRLPTAAPRPDRRPPTVRLRPLVSLRRALARGRLGVRARCSEPCSVHIDLGQGDDRSEAVAPSRGVAVVRIDRMVARLIRLGLRRRGHIAAGYAATDRAGNLRRGRLRLEG